ncbi:hypothetical protein [Flavobacterium suncheonense]|uniref:General stress protein 17M-like domain-containing protein n=1 Tax=Flavobacterium suncheonense GH29-5 = DSM 17707 TaxID=1121899 RepID=A0A0A2MDY4_9FLAO|nr:hypothetical protein [Flavobacterium suncheonense]KGO89811.1 hypothetical protein Q764_06390 [Flavobacterium suncheonense GH29-5 = DSM 17707]
MKSKIAIYETHKEAVDAIKTLHDHGFPMKNVSLIGTAEVIDDHIHVRTSDVVQKAPAVIGIGAGTVIGLLSGIGVFTIPGFGFLYGAGALVGAVAGFDLGIVTGGLISFFAYLGIKEDEVVKYEEHLKEGKFMVVLNGSMEEIEQAEHILHTEGAHLEL